MFRALSGELTSMSYRAFRFFLGQQFMKRFLITKRTLQFVFHLSVSNKSALDKRLLLTVVGLFWPVNGIQPDFGVCCKRSKRALVQPNSLIANLSLQKPARIQGILMENHLMTSTHFKVFQKISTDKVNRVLVLHVHIYSLQDQFVVQNLPLRSH